MESVLSYFNSQGMDFWNVLKVCGISLLATLVLALLGRFLFGKKSTLNCSISTAISILFLYIATILLITFAPSLHWLVNPLPFTTISNGFIHLFSFQNVGYAPICSQLLSMIVLAFFMNLADNWLPKGKRVISWLFFRLVTIALGLIMHGIITYLFTAYLPQELVTYAPTVLLAILVLMLLTGALKLVVGAVMATVNPLIAVLYTFFFASIVGKQITKAVLATALLAGLVYLMGSFGIVSLCIAPGALFAYIPFVATLSGMWYVVHKTI